jgi:nicotinate phosphoribosyltransferase
MQGMRNMSALLTDLYQLTMFQAYLEEEGMDQPATFELFVRKLPAGRNFLVAAGLEQALQFLETLAFSKTRSHGSNARADSRGGCWPR